MAFCAKCGNELREGANYCDRCGAPVRSGNLAYPSSPRDQKGIRRISTALVILGLLMLVGGFLAYVVIAPHDINILLLALISVPILVVALIMRSSVKTRS